MRIQTLLTVIGAGFMLLLVWALIGLLFIAF